MIEYDKAKHFLRLSDHHEMTIKRIIRNAMALKEKPEKTRGALAGKNMLMIFAKPSLRTRVSFEVAMAQLGGTAIFYDVADSPMGHKESIADTARVTSRYVDVIMARLLHHGEIEEFAAHSTVPVINAMTDLNHPVQMLADFMTIMEKKDNIEGLKLAYYGDANNNVTNSLLFACAIFGVNIAVCCPPEDEFGPKKKILEEAYELARETGISIQVTSDPTEGAVAADVIYTDSWMSYHIPKEQETARTRFLLPYQVTPDVLEYARKDVIFMNCLPAKRGHEQTADVIDGPRSVVFDQAENRLHTTKALLMFLMGVE